MNNDNEDYYIQDERDDNNEIDNKNLCHQDESEISNSPTMSPGTKTLLPNQHILSNSSVKTIIKRTSIEVPKWIDRFKKTNEEIKIDLISQIELNIDRHDGLEMNRLKRRRPYQNKRYKSITKQQNKWITKNEKEVESIEHLNIKTSLEKNLISNLDYKRYLHGLTNKTWEVEEDFEIEHVQSYDIFEHKKP